MYGVRHMSIALLALTFAETVDISILGNTTWRCLWLVSRDYRKNEGRGDHPSFYGGRGREAKEIPLLEINIYSLRY